MLALATAFGAQARDSLQISLLTCSQGRDISSAFGHSALRVKDLKAGTDIVYNYGTFSFDEPHFLLKFLRGDLNYCLSTSKFRNFTYSYSVAGRGIIEQPLDLTPEQATQIYSFLRHNALPENRFYLYDFLQDNCATRIRDIFDHGGFTYEDRLTDLTYRDELDRLVGGRRWMMFGIDLLLGARVDRKITTQETAFLPDRLSEVFVTYQNDSLGKAPLAPTINIIQEPAPAPGKGHEILAKVTSPFTVFIVLFLFFLLYFMRTGNKRTFLKIFSNIIYCILGTGGIILALMWFATNHVWTAENWNLLWMNPLFFIPVFMRENRAKGIVINVLTIIAAFELTGTWLVPQTFHPATSIIVLLLVLMAFSRKAIARK